MGTRLNSTCGFAFFSYGRTYSLPISCLDKLSVFLKFCSSFNFFLLSNFSLSALTGFDRGLNFGRGGGLGEGCGTEGNLF